MVVMQIWMMAHSSSIDEVLLEGRRWDSDRRRLDTQFTGMGDLRWGVCGGRE